MFRKIRSFLHIAFFKRSLSRETISADVIRWIQIKEPERLNDSLVDNISWLLETYPEFRNLFYFRLGRFTNLASRLAFHVAKILYAPISTLKFSDISCVGPGLFLEYGFVTLIGAQRIGRNCWINPGVTIGYKTGLEKSLSIIGDNVYIGAGAKILGSVTIGDNVVVGANAVVIHDVPPNCTVAGVPAKVIKTQG